MTFTVQFASTSTLLYWPSSDKDTLAFYYCSTDVYCSCFYQYLCSTLLQLVSSLEVLQYSKHSSTVIACKMETRNKLQHQLAIMNCIRRKQQHCLHCWLHCLCSYSVWCVVSVMSAKCYCFHDSLTQNASKLPTSQSTAIAMNFNHPYCWPSPSLLLVT